MASRKGFNARLNYIYPTMEIGTDHHVDLVVTNSNDLCELDEADIWSFDNNRNGKLDSKKSVPSSSSKPNKPVKQRSNQVKSCASASFPVNIPDWSKILKDHDHSKYAKRESDGYFDDSEDEDDEEDRLPPHEFLARRRGTSFSVHEGIGGTLKGREQSRLRNAIWKKTGLL